MSTFGKFTLYYEYLPWLDEHCAYREEYTGSRFLIEPNPEFTKGIRPPVWCVSSDAKVKYNNQPKYFRIYHEGEEDA